MKLRLGLVMASVMALLGTTVGVADAASTTSAAVAPPNQDAFYRYSGSTPLAEIAPGTVLNTRTVQAHIETLPTPVQVVQLLYRTTDEVGDPSTTVTSVLKAPGHPSSSKMLSYQSFYDTLSPDCQPSYALAGGFDRGFLSLIENAAMIALFTQGYSIVTSDFEGQQAHFAAGHEYGRATLDGIRAALNSPAAGFTPDAKVAMAGYSGGAIASQWAAQQAPQYAPDVNRRLVGVSIGGVFADPMHNLKYVDGSLAWAAVMPMAIMGIARAYHLDLSPYLNERGEQTMASLRNACFVGGIARNLGGLKFAQLVKPQYADPASIPPLADITKKLIMGTTGTPTVPMKVNEGANGALNGTFTNNIPGIGPGDGVMVAGDVRTLLRNYCSRGVPVDYQENPFTEHVGTAIVNWLPQTVGWLKDRFDGKTAPDNCAAIKPGNAL